MGGAGLRREVGEKREWERPATGQMDPRRGRCAVRPAAVGGLGREVVDGQRGRGGESRERLMLGYLGPGAPFATMYPHSKAVGFLLDVAVPSSAAPGFPGEEPGAQVLGGELPRPVPTSPILPRSPNCQVSPRGRPACPLTSYA